MAPPLLRYRIILFCLTSLHSCTDTKESTPETAAPITLQKASSADASNMESAMAQIAGRIDAGVRNGEFTAAQVLVAHRGAILLEQVFGSLSKTPGAPAVTSESPFLVASITKPVTATAVMMLVAGNQK